jgi:hypothetical protein
MFHKIVVEKSMYKILEKAGKVLTLSYSSISKVKCCTESLVWAELDAEVRRAGVFLLAA